ncbi:SlyX family protein [Devosia sp. ZB163]|uniref:SlyX family protein n=1 Tax=Devosia sp. ZB163 TaxID=3025938 RepID=UPI00235DD4BA|nr:SlyX family protein [Devosia sp. ZB163]MDC9824526.1 SlyX family protein [Devosia sp. ZB163]
MTQEPDLDLDVAARIEKLETTIAFQDQTIEELSQALAGHFKEIEALKREVHNLGSQLRDVESHPALTPPAEPPPPHY